MFLMMKERIKFRNQVEEYIQSLDEHSFAFNKDEYWMIFSFYEYLEYYSFENRLWNTCIALPLARGLHDGTYRKSSITKNGNVYRLPYVTHCLLVCRMLADLKLPVTKEEEDIILASALCHDMIEDLPFDNDGRELYEEYHLDKRIYDIVKLVSKRKDFTTQEEIEHFKKIQENKYALLVKLSDRSNNVEDLYNMSSEKIDEYVLETNRFILPMCEYGLQHYEELVMPLKILKDKIILLTTTAKTMVDHYEKQERHLRNQLKALRIENKRLFKELEELWER